ncbi:MAG: hypothetical protein ACLGJB_18200 [Blastocatellia bacterium]
MRTSLNDLGLLPQKLALAHDLGNRFARGGRRREIVQGVLRSGKSQLVAEVSDETLATIVEDDEHLEMISGLGLKSWMAVPLVAHACSGLSHSLWPNRATGMATSTSPSLRTWLAARAWPLNDKHALAARVKSVFRSREPAR